MQGNSQTIKKKSWIDNMLDKIERAGNKLPDPITLFIILAGVVLVLSWVLSMLGISAVQPGTEDVIQVKNLLSQEGLILILTQMVSTFTGFAPLGLVIVTMIGIGLAEQTGLISAVMKKIVMSAPTKLIV
ncbi:AbgT family transporter, partial [Lysinibacillus capsici]